MIMYLQIYYTMNTPETQSPIDTTDIPIDNIGNRKTLRKKGSASTNETQL